MLDLPSIRSCLAAQPRFGDDGAADEPDVVRQAAVAVVLRETAGATEVLFIKRAEKAGDPWSGHMAFPGGHRDPGDASLAAAAVRETAEEVGLDISSAPLLGALQPQRPMSVRSNMLVAPFVFEIDGDPSFTLNHEVAAAVWAPLGPMHRGENHARSRPPFDAAADAAAASGGSGAFDGFRLARGYFVWGMTYRMVQTFFETIDPSYRASP